MSCYCDYGSVEFYHKERPIAKIEHKCYECGCHILPGEKYERVRAKWDGDVCVVKTCPDCVEIRDALSEMDCFCWRHGSLLDDVQMQFQDAFFSPGLRYAYLRILARHRRNRHINT